MTNKWPEGEPAEELLYRLKLEWAEYNAARLEPLDRSRRIDSEERINRLLSGVLPPKEWPTEEEAMAIGKEYASLYVYTANGGCGDRGRENELTAILTWRACYSWLREWMGK